MSFRSVYRSLQEVFPQVDLRILKAVAIEHSMDVDAAVEFIILEVLPSLSAPQEESHTHSNIREESPEVKRSYLGFSSSPGNEEANSSSLHSYESEAAENCHGTDYTTAVLHDNSLRQEKIICDGSSVAFVVESNQTTRPLEHEEILDEVTRSKPSKTSPTCEDIFVNDATNESVATQPFSVIQDGSSSGDQLWSHEMVEPVQLDKNHHKPNAGSSSVSSLIQCEDTVVERRSLLLADTQGLFGLDVPSTLGKTSQDIFESSLEENLVSVQPAVQPGLVAEDALRTFFNGCGDEPSFSVNNSAELFFLDSESTVDDEHPMSTSARSVNTVNIDFLEEFVTDCKGIKNTLVSAMESVMDMMKEVDLREKEAGLAKEAASKAGLDILEKVEDLKVMLKHAREANNMHAGEVYGEKSILATEARELQARLLSLSDQRCRSLVIIEEIHQTLKARLATAEGERIKAEQEKLEKEEQAHKALVEQQEIMERVVQESKELQKEAEENSKLREFLMERGHLVDTLQGEISVICEDVLALKERVDGRMPLGRTLSSSQALTSLAASTSSRTSVSSDKVPCPVEAASENHRSKSQGILKAEQQVEASIKSSEKLIVDGADHGKAMSDDDWEYFDGGGYGGGPGGGCYNCGEEGHVARHCPQGSGGGGSGGGGRFGGGISCYNCGEEGHLARHCRQGSGVAGISGMSCYSCGEEGHFARECPNPGGMSSYNCGEEGHFAKECPHPGSKIVPP